MSTDAPPTEVLVTPEADDATAVPARKLPIFKILLTGLAIFVLLLEVMVRVLLSGKGVLIPGEIGIWDTQRGWAYLPSLSATSDRTGRDIEYRTNSHGLRDVEMSYDKAPGVFRIVLAGQSEAVGAGVTYDESYARVVEQYFDRVEIVNLSVGAYGTDQSFLYLQEEGFKYHPDLVIMHIPHFDGHRHMKPAGYGGNKPWFTVENDALKLNGVPVPGTTPGPFASVNKFIGRYSKLYGLLSKLGGPVPPTREVIDSTDAKNAQDPVYGKLLYELPRRLAQQAAKDSAEHGAQFMLLCGVHRVCTESAAAGLTVLDTGSVLDNPLYPLSEELRHYTPSGHGALSWELARFLAENHLVPADHLRAPLAALVARDAATHAAAAAPAPAPATP